MVLSDTLTDGIQTSKLFTCVYCGLCHNTDKYLFDAIPIESGLKETVLCPHCLLILLQKMIPGKLKRKLLLYADDVNLLCGIMNTIKTK